MQLKYADLMRCYAGSIAYGTNLPTSDTDIRGIVCVEPVAIRTPFFAMNEISLPEYEDGKLYELTHFFKLFVDMNPNIIELLYVDQDDVMFTTPVYDFLRSHAPRLLSKKVAFTFSGYAMSQLGRLRGHNRWLTNPQPVEKPVQRDYVRDVFKRVDLNTIAKDCVFYPYGDNVYAVVRTDKVSPGLFNDDGSLRLLDNAECNALDAALDPVCVARFFKADYEVAAVRHRQYWEWHKNRNPARHETEVQFGYDTKCAMHLVRLMRMAEEILVDGVVNVKRPDAQELLAIRAGDWAYDDLISWAESKDREIKEVLYHKSPLPRGVDLRHAAKVLMVAQSMGWDILSQQES